MPRCLIIAGPNGAGKTTFALKHLPRVGVRHFLNVDMIASGLSPFAPETQAAAAGRLFLGEMEALINTGEDFAFETTLSGRGYVRLIERLKTSGWGIVLYYIALPSPELSKSRVAERFAHGGHNIPSIDIERRFPRSLRNLFDSYRMIVDQCVCYLNAESVMSLVFEQAGSEVAVYDRAEYERLKAYAQRER